MPFQPPKPTPTQRLHHFIHHPITDMVVVVLILVSVALLVAEAALDTHPMLQTEVRLLGDTITAIFVVELTIRFLVAPKKRRFFRGYWMDILAVLPLARPLRLLRVLYLLRLFRAGMLLNRRVGALSGMMRGTWNEVSFMLTLTLVLVLVAAVMIDIDAQSIFLDYPGFEGILWYAIYTLVGNEPIGGMPSDSLGRWVTLGLMLGGIVVFGVFIGTVSASMITVLSKRMEIKDVPLDELSDHVVICGWNTAGPSMLRELVGMGDAPAAVVLVTEQDELPEDMPKIPGLRADLFYHHKGDYTRVATLEEVGIKRAAACIILTDLTTARSPQDQDARTVLAALTIERLHKDIFCCAQLNDEEPASLLRMAGVEEIVVGDWFTGTILGSISRNRGMVYVLHDILTTHQGNAFHKVKVPRALDGRTVGEVYKLLKDKHNAILVSRERGADICVNPPSTEALQSKDVLVVISKGPVKLKG